MNIVNIKKIFNKIKKVVAIIHDSGINGLFREINNRIKSHDSYAQWYNYESKRITIESYMQEFTYNPLISILLATYNSDYSYLRECLDSILGQFYKNFELCIADDASTDDNVRRIIEEYAQKDSRIKYVFRETNGHIANATNSALEIATGEYLTMVDHDDILPNNALFEFARVLNDKKYKLIYSDEDKLDKNGKRFQPYFKPNFAPDTFNSIMYIGHLSLYLRELVLTIGGFYDEYRGCQDYEMTRRYIANIDYKDIYHIPKILYHWRVAQGSIADNPENKIYAFENAKKAIERDIAQKGDKCNLNFGPFYGTYSLEYIPSRKYKISIIICTCDKVDYLDKLIKSIKCLTTYDNYEIIIVNNNSIEEATLRYLAILEDERMVKVISINEEFNFSRLNNIAVDYATGDFLLFLNNDMILLTSDWLEKMLGYAEKSHIGAVGAKLYYENKNIQHAGVILGYGTEGIAGHIYAGVDQYHTGYYGSLAVPYNYAAVTGACLMVAKAKFLAAGKFDEKFKVAYNDVDFCLRLIHAGYFNIYLPFVELIHYESKSRGVENTPEKLIRFLNEAQMFKQKWRGYILDDPYYNKNLSLNPSTLYLPVINRNSEFRNKIFSKV